MGKPVNIYNLAKEMLNEYKTYGNTNDDIQINIIGLRPGEKLHEELCHENFQQETTNPNIFLDNYTFKNQHFIIDEMIKNLQNICLKKEPKKLIDFFKNIQD